MTDPTGPPGHAQPSELGALLRPTPTIAILRGYDPARAGATARRCWDAGVGLVEVPVQGDAGWSALQAVLDCAEGRPVGAGTVLEVAAAERAVGLGVRALVTPGFDAEIVACARDLGAAVLPGVATATEVTAAWRAGVGLCKLFPAAELGPGYLKALQGPFPDVGFVAVGGVDAGNAAGFMDAGAAGVAFGGSIERVLSLPEPGAFLAALRRRRG